MTRPNHQQLIPAVEHNLNIYRITALQQYPTLKHAIFTRQGGRSRAPYHSLNLSISTGDDPHTVEQNFQLACQSQGIDPVRVAGCHLVHGRDVITVTPDNLSRNMGQADTLITQTPGAFLFMRFADCTPLLFFDPVVQAVGVAHAGWRGTMQNAAGATVAAMQKEFGSHPENLIAVIGPAIGPCCYEVGPEVIAAGHKNLSHPTALFRRRNGLPGNGEQAHFDLWAANYQQLAAAGVGEIIKTDLCTACNTDHFFSHRAERGATGRFGVIIGLRETR